MENLIIDLQEYVRQGKFNKDLFEELYNYINKDDIYNYIKDRIKNYSDEDIYYNIEKNQAELKLAYEWGYITEDLYNRIHEELYKLQYSIYSAEDLIENLF